MSTIYNNFKRSKKGAFSNLISACIASSLVLPVLAVAQSDAPELEEVVVTGSYIRNSAFAGASPVDTVSQADLLESGAPAMGQYIRDLPYTQNTDVVANVNSTQNGQQDSNAARFNLRGLGVNSTLTLVDGTRSVNDGAVASLLPDIAMSRLEVVLDGGSALYGSDAVAGVVNLIPMKEFDGVRVRAYYQQDQDRTFEEPKLAMLFGRSFDNNINWVAALEASKKSSVLRHERPRYLDFDISESSSGNPGVFQRAAGGIGDGGTGGLLRDPACGTYNEGFEDKTVSGAYPSGQPLGSTTCLFHYGPQHDYARGNVDYTFFNNLTWDASDWLQFELQSSYNYRESRYNTSSSLSQSTNNQFALLVPGDHPANPFGFDVVPRNWRPFTGTQATQPSFLEDDGREVQDYRYYTNSNKLSARYDMTDTWTGYTYYTIQETRRSVETRTLLLPRLQAALAGEGGVDGNGWFNPFGSADPRSPDYVEGVTSNSQALVDWMYDERNQREVSRNNLEIFETMATGEVFQTPWGAAQMAAGYQRREARVRERPNPFSVIGQNYNSSITEAPPVATDYDDRVNAYFVEFETPLYETVSLQLAARHESFVDQNLNTTTPKVALRWEVLPELALRASWGESFLAPAPGADRPFNPNEGCGEVFSGNDPVTGGTLAGATSCASGNPDIRPETSEIRNLGLTWEPLNELSLSLDYQRIDYEDRIRDLSTVDAVQLQFAELLSAIGSTPAAYDSTPGSATRQAANAWLATQQGQLTGPGVQRNPDNQQVVKTIRNSANIAEVMIDLVDAKARYSIPTNDLGTFVTTLGASYFLKYEYTDLFGVVRDARGRQNGDSGIVPPMPKMKANLRLNWFKDNHSASMSANYQHNVTTDGSFFAYTTGYKAARTIDAQTLVNTQYSYIFDDVYDSELTLSLGITNLFDQRAQRLPQLGGFESRLQTPWGRQFWLSLDWQPF
ncbi:hypothetical protein LCGC14_0022740 [marine sediment metagenome]|uniref:TonB-dependent receptor plug domain-containing protein n=1 Tax=marine sediment metagenome TaxID=412755 RepID=A0A0F9W0K2_9ZZZZ|nr:TonB-dependent receptor [Pseudohongiella sp.]HEA62763.1 TonB-dependent receptor [Pseudohongiella sp.]